MSDVVIRKFQKCINAPDDTKLPKRGTKFSAGYDFYAPCDIYVPRHGFSELVFFNVKALMPSDEYLAIVIRSSMATKYQNGHLMVAQGTAIIDADYYGNPDNDGNIGVMFYNRSEHDIVIPKGDRCCQGIFQKYYTCSDDVTERLRVGGYGSTGV